MTHDLRPVLDDAQFRAYDDLEHAAEALIRGVAGRRSLEQLRSWYTPATAYRTWEASLLYVDGRPVGLASVHCRLQDNLETADLGVTVHPDERGRGYGRVLADWAVARARELGRTRLSAYVEVPYAPGRLTSFDHLAGGRLAAAYGLTCRTQEVGRVLDLPIPEARLDDLAASARARQGDYQVVTWVGDIPEEHFAAYGPLLTQLELDDPHEDAVFEAPDYPPERLAYLNQRYRESGRTGITAVAITPDGTMVGNSELVWSTSDDDPVIEQENTLVMPAHRGHGLGLAMKVATHRAIAELAPAKRIVRTWNNEINDFMVGINEALGYRPASRDLCFQGPTPAAG